MPISLALILLVFVLVAAVLGALGALQANRRRLEIIARAGGADAALTSKVPLLAVKDPDEGVAARLARITERLLPAGTSTDTNDELMIRAGFESPNAPAVYALIRMVSALVVPGIMFAVSAHSSTMWLVISGAIGIGAGLLGPPAVLSRLTQRRQMRIRHSIPDSLDLLLVCVEAGVSLDAAILRVGKEMAILHPELSDELLTMNRRMNAGMRREDALHGLFQRTGVEELRALSSNMIQSERWGTSIAKVLRVYSETLRRKRRQAAEKKAAVAATKMVFPLAMFILPALFAVIGGPAIMTIGPALDALVGK